MPKVSVIIPCYNRGAYIRETVQSVLQQTFTDFELITVDDGSTDNTREILDSFGGQLTVLEHPGGVNKGQSAAVNLGIEHSSGSYIAILDSDDFWHQDKLKKQMAVFSAQPDADLVYCNGEAVDAGGKRLYDIYEPGHVETNDPAMLLLDCYIAIPSNALVRRSLYDKAGLLDESMRATQDHDLGIRLAEVGKFVYLDEKLWSYRRHGDSISSQNADRRWRIGFEILERAARRYPYSRSVLKRRRAVLHFRLAQCHAERRRYGRAIGNAIRSGLLDPMRAVRVLLRREAVSSPH